MSRLSNQISSFNSNSYQIPTNSFKFTLDFNQSIPKIDIMNTNPSFNGTSIGFSNGNGNGNSNGNENGNFNINEGLYGDPNAFVSKNALFYPGIETFIGEKKVGGEPLKQYFSALANATDGSNVLPLPDHKISYGIYNVAYREKDILSTPESKVVDVPELSNPTTVTTTPPSTTFIYQPLPGDYYSSQSQNSNAYPPSPVSPKFRTISSNNSPYSYMESTVTLTPNSKNEIPTPLSSVTYNSSIISTTNTMMDEDPYSQCYCDSSCNPNYNNNNNSSNNSLKNSTTTSSYYNNDGNKRNLNQPPPSQQQNLYYISGNDHWKLQQLNNESSCFYSRRKQELKQMASQSPNNINNVRLSFQCPPNYQVQVSLNQQPQPPFQPNLQTGIPSSEWSSTSTNINTLTTTATGVISSDNTIPRNSMKNNTSTPCIPQLIVQSNSPFQQIIVQQPQPNQPIIYHHPSSFSNNNLIHGSYTATTSSNEIVVKPPPPPQQQQQQLILRSSPLQQQQIQPLTNNNKPVPQVIVQSPIQNVAISMNSQFNPMASTTMTTINNNGNNGNYGNNDNNGNLNSNGVPVSIFIPQRSDSYSQNNTIQQVIVQLQGIQNSNMSNHNHSQNNAISGDYINNNTNGNAYINGNVSQVQGQFVQNKNQSTFIQTNGITSPVTPISYCKLKNIKQEFGPSIKNEMSSTMTTLPLPTLNMNNTMKEEEKDKVQDKIKMEEMGNENRNENRKEKEKNDKISKNENENEKMESKMITPISSPVMEDKKKENLSMIINLSNYKPINSHKDNYNRNRPAVLKFIPHKSKSISTPRKRVESHDKIIKSSNSHYKCDICQKEFPKSYQMKSHLRTHMSEKPFKCEFCTRAFCRKHDLARHIRIHTGDTPYICSKCFKGFARSDACTRHVRQNLCKRQIINYNPETNHIEVPIQDY